MGFHQFRARQTLPISLDEAWSFFADPRNLREITPDWLGFELKTPDLPEEMYPGLMVAYTVRPIAGLPVGWVTEITQVVPKVLFVDEQRRGPYSLWHHEHHFREIPGGVEARDIVSYAVPLGPLGDLVNLLTVRGKVRDIFRHRRRVLEARFGVHVPPPSVVDTTANGATPAP